MIQLFSHSALNARAHRHALRTTQSKTPFISSIEDYDLEHDVLRTHGSVRNYSFARRHDQVVLLGQRDQFSVWIKKLAVILTVVWIFRACRRSAP
ncbi:hypothetical protein BaRGS_00039290 [Batillaria attramentaria]|uniref:Uncharacterized protein n=1 Tax=Batillaria attramentaria TaxID=370345 RepID=A0ABD0J3F7_9CAEN